MILIHYPQAINFDSNIQTAMPFDPYNRAPTFFNTPACKSSAGTHLDAATSNAIPTTPLPMVKTSIILCPTCRSGELLNKWPEDPDEQPTTICRHCHAKFLEHEKKHRQSREYTSFPSLLEEHGTKKEQEDGEDVGGRNLWKIGATYGSVGRAFSASLRAIRGSWKGSEKGSGSLRKSSTASVDSDRSLLHEE